MISGIFFKFGYQTVKAGFFSIKKWLILPFKKARPTKLGKKING
jgi:hypothetical protein